MEMSAFRDAESQFAGKNAQVLGVSMDDLETQKKFAESLKLPFPLLADPRGEAAEAFGIKNGTHASRTTFVIGPDQKIVQVIDGMSALGTGGALEACPLHKPAAPPKKAD